MVIKNEKLKIQELRIIMEESKRWVYFLNFYFEERNKERRIQRIKRKRTNKHRRVIRKGKGYLQKGKNIE